MKKFVAIILACLFTLSFAFGACALESAEPLLVVCTTFPQYDWVREILGSSIEDVELTLLLDNGMDLHSYQPTAADIANISACDLFIYVGGESDEWVNGVLAAAQNPDMTVISMVGSVEAKPEEHVEGMQEPEHEHEHEQEHEQEHEHHHDDEHVWLSLRNAQTIIRAISSALCGLDAENAKLYAENAESYIAKLAELDARYRVAADSALRKTLVFADRFPFRYLADDYGIEYFAAFSGCSAETEASFETIVFLAGKVNELQLPAVMVIEGVNHSIAETVVASTQAKDQKILTLDSIQSVSQADITNGETYLAIMERNLLAFEEALN